MLLTHTIVTLKKINKSIVFIFIFSAFSFSLAAQDFWCKTDSFFMSKNEFDSKRFYSGIGIGAVIYGSGTYFLYDSWYKGNGVGQFHFFDDRNEWLRMDKIGHVYTAYNQSNIMYNAAKWTGLCDNKSIFFGVTMGMLLQSTVEVLDGFSPKWGFSVSDMGANVLGASMFFAEQKYWGEQKIIFKVSSSKRNYSDVLIRSDNGIGFTSLSNRANDLFGSSFAQRYLKDYNTQTYWLSMNINSLFGAEKVPSWLNIAVGYSGENMFGGYDNKWKDLNGFNYSLGKENNRYAQFLLAPDIDFSRIKVNSYFWNTFFKGLNIFKLPTPALEINTRGEVILHLLYL